MSSPLSFAHPLNDVEILASYPSTQGMTLHSLTESVVFPCGGCEQLRESCMVAANARGLLLCPGCYADLMSDAV